MEGGGRKLEADQQYLRMIAGCCPALAGAVRRSVDQDLDMRTRKHAVDSDRGTERREATFNGRSKQRRTTPRLVGGSPLARPKRDACCRIHFRTHGP
jgi:hypothetical protein